MFWIWYEFKKNGKSESYGVLCGKKKILYFVGSKTFGRMVYTFFKTELRLKQHETTYGMRFLFRSSTVSMKPLGFTSPLRSGQNDNKHKKNGMKGTSTTARPTCQTLRSNKKRTRIPVF